MEPGKRALLNDMGGEKVSLSIDPRIFRTRIPQLTRAQLTTSRVECGFYILERNKKMLMHHPRAEFEFVHMRV